MRKESNPVNAFKNYITGKKNYNKTLTNIIENGKTVMFVPENYTVADVNPIVYSRKLHNLNPTSKNLFKDGIATFIDRKKVLDYYGEVTEIIPVKYGESKIISTPYDDENKTIIEAYVNLTKYGFNAENIGFACLNDNLYQETASRVK